MKRSTVEKLTTDSNKNEKGFNLHNTKTLPYCFNLAIRHVGMQTYFDSDIK